MKFNFFHLHLFFSLSETLSSTFGQLSLFGFPKNDLFVACPENLRVYERSGLLFPFIFFVLHVTTGLLGKVNLNLSERLLICSRAYILVRWLVTKWQLKRLIHGVLTMVKKIVASAFSERFRFFFFFFSISVCWCLIVSFRESFANHRKKNVRLSFWFFFSYHICEF